MRLILLFLSSVVSFCSAVSISLVVDLLSESNAIRDYFLLQSFISPLASVKTNTSFITELKKIKNSDKTINKIEIIIILTLFFYFWHTSSSFLLATVYSLICYLCSSSLSAISTKVSLLSSLQSDLQGPKIGIEAYIFRLIAFVIFFVIVQSITGSTSFFISPPVIALGFTGLSLFIYRFSRLKDINIRSLEKNTSKEYNEGFSHQQNRIATFVQLFTSVFVACWTSIDRWFLGAMDIPSETFRTVSWAQTIAIAVASISFSSLYKYCKPQKFVSFFKKTMSSNSFFYISMTLMLVVSIVASELIIGEITALQGYIIVENYNILTITLISVFFQRLGTYILYQEHNLKWNITFTVVMFVFLCFSCPGFYILARKNIYLGEFFIMLCSIFWFFTITALNIYRKKFVFS